jgi:ElaB/YqjD/DUF883 family membrane-anchored ribosome-binding protein
VTLKSWSGHLCVTRVIRATSSRIAFPSKGAIYILRAFAETQKRADTWDGNQKEIAMPEENKSKQEESGMTDAQDKLESSKTHARKAAEDLKSAAGAIAGEYRGKAEQAWGDARGKAEQAWGDATERARTFQEDAEQYVRENPTKAVFTALGIGFVLGLIFRR